MKTEDIEFKGGTYDRQTEGTYVPIRLRKVVKATFYTCFGLLIAVGTLKSITDIGVPRWFPLAGFAGMAASVVSAFICKSLAEKAPKCTCCGNPMALITTLPSQTERDERGYVQGKSGHAYTKESGRHGEAVFEVRKHWYGCGTCKRYVLLDDQVTEIISGIEKRESDYANADQVIRAFVERRNRQGSKANQRSRGTR